MKSNKKLIIIICGVILLIGIVLAITIITLNKNNKTDNEGEKIVDTTYTAYVSINPLVKLTFKVSCKNDVCSEPIITDYELENDDAKEIYKDIDIKNKTIEETMDILYETATNNDINVKKIHIYTNYDKEFSTDVHYDIDVQIKDDEELTDDNIEEIIGKEDYITKVVRFSVPDQVCYADDFNLKEYVMKMGNFTSNYSLDKATIEIIGPENILANMCTDSYKGYGDVCNSQTEIAACISIGNLEPGQHQVPIEIKPLIDGIEISDKRPNIIYNIEIIKRP